MFSYLFTYFKAVNTALCFGNWLYSFLNFSIQTESLHDLSSQISINIFSLQHLDWASMESRPKHLLCSHIYTITNDGEPLPQWAWLWAGTTTPRMRFGYCQLMSWMVKGLNAQFVFFLLSSIICFYIFHSQCYSSHCLVVCLLGKASRWQQKLQRVYPARDHASCCVRYAGG